MLPMYFVAFGISYVHRGAGLLSTDTDLVKKENTGNSTIKCLYYSAVLTFECGLMVCLIFLFFFQILSSLKTFFSITQISGNISVCQGVFKVFKE